MHHHTNVYLERNMLRSTRIRGVGLLVGLAVLLAASHTSHAQAPAAAQPAAQAAQPRAPGAGTVPQPSRRSRAAWKDRLAVRIRGTDNSCLVSTTPNAAGAALTRSALAPVTRTGRTSHAQPVLYWQLSTPTPCQIDFTLIDETSIEPLLEIPLSTPDRPVSASVQQVRLADHGIQLSPGVRYRWFVAIILDPAARSKDTVVSGTIERVEPSQALRDQLTQVAQAEPARVPTLYAEAGLWYDALMLLADMIQAAPQDSRLQQQRTAVLEQEGLGQLAGTAR